MGNTKLGKVVLELPPNAGADNPRNSEGAFYTLGNGDILFAYSRFRGKSAADNAFADICMLRSKDGGLTFGEERTILTCEGEKAVNIMSLSFLKMRNGDVGLFYLVRTTYTLLQMFMRRSADGGQTWGERALCTPVKGFFVVNNDRVIRLSNGRILIPAASHYAEEGYFDNRADVVFFCSDDDGYTWGCTGAKCSMPYLANCTSGLQEPGVIELACGYLMAWARTDLGRQYQMFSADYGNTWTACEPSRFTSPCSPLSMKRDNSGAVYALWNPVPGYNGQVVDRFVFTGRRTPFVLAKSQDNGKTFSQPIVIEDEPEHGYCYCAIHFTGTALLLAYCAGGIADGSCLARTKIRYIELAELEAEFVLGRHKLQ